MKRRLIEGILQNVRNISEEDNILLKAVLEDMTECNNTNLIRNTIMYMKEVNVECRALTRMTKEQIKSKT